MHHLGSHFTPMKKGTPMTVETHLATLQEKHTRLESRITSELQRPAADLETVQTLKKQKLRLKEEMERLRHCGDQRRHAA